MLDAVLEPALATPHPTPATKPELGFLGVGWIGRSRLEAIANHGAATVACVADPLPENTAEALRVAPMATVVASLPALLAQPGLAGVVKPELRPQITGKYRVGDIRHCYADISLAQEKLGFYPQVEFDSGLEELAAWLAGQIAYDRVTGHLKLL